MLQIRICSLLSNSSHGLPEAARAFNEQHLDKTLRDMGFRRLQSDPQLYLKRISPDDFVIICTHVDDLFLISRQTVNITHVGSSPCL